MSRTISVQVQFHIMSSWCFTSLVFWSFATAVICQHGARFQRGLAMEDPSSASSSESSECPPPPECSLPAPRRYDIFDMGYQNMFRGWVDVQGQGAANDYCRFVGNPEDNDIRLACALAGTEGESDMNYVSQINGFDRGYEFTWYMKDEDNDGRDDYCRCIGDKPEEQKVMCTKAGPNGFYGSEKQEGNPLTFQPLDSPSHCSKRKVRPEFGREYLW